MSSLRERIELLENDLKAVPPRISVYHDLPFAILRYDPGEEWDLRREVKMLATRLEATGKTNIIAATAIARGDMRAISKDQIERTRIQIPRPGGGDRGGADHLQSFAQIGERTSEEKLQQ